MSSQDVDVNEWLVSAANRCDRIVVTAARPFNAEDRSKNDLLLDIRDPDEILSFVKLLEVGISSKAHSWMSPVDIVFNFLFERQPVAAVGLVLRGFLRSSAWAGDYEIRMSEEFVRWCQEKGISDHPRW